MLRLGFCEATDFTGSAVDMIERGLTRLCRDNREIHEWLDVYMGMTDTVVEMSEYDRNQQGIPFAEGDNLYLTIENGQAQVVSLRGILNLMEDEHELLPCAFFYEYVRLLVNFVGTYTVEDAENVSDMWKDDLDEEEFKESLYSQIPVEMPDSMRPMIREFVQKLGKEKQRALLNRFRTEARSPEVREVLDLVCRARELSTKYDKTDLMTRETREFFYSNDFESPLPGVILCWDEHDAVRGLFDEDYQMRMQSGQPFMPWMCLQLRLREATEEATPLSDKRLDARVKEVMDFVMDMAQSLKLACQAMGIIRGVYETFCEDRRKSGLPAEAGAPGVRRK